MRAKHADRAARGSCPTRARSTRGERSRRGHGHLAHQHGLRQRVALDEYRQQRRGGAAAWACDTKEDDWIAHLFVASAHDWVLFFTSRGRVYRVKA